MVQEIEKNAQELISEEEKEKRRAEKRRAKKKVRGQSLFKLYHSLWSNLLVII